MHVWSNGVSADTYSHTTIKRVFRGVRDEHRISAAPDIPDIYQIHTSYARYTRYSK